MPIYAPGFRRGRHVNLKRDVVAVLQLTAMVDMFTVLVVFLLQNYAVTNQILPISEELQLPKAAQVKELKPSYTVILRKGDVILNEDNLGKLESQTSKVDWSYPPLLQKMKELLEKEPGGTGFLRAQLERIKQSEENEQVIKQAPFRVTIQADEGTPFFDVKKIMYTLTEAGIKEMNFAVIKKLDLKALGEESQPE